MKIMQTDGKILSDMIMLVTCEYLWGPLDNSENAILKFILVDMVSEETLYYGYVTPLSALALPGNLGENWPRFKLQLEIYEIASGLVRKDGNVRAMTLLLVAGSEAL